MANLIAHQKQYVLGPAPVTLRPDWVTVRIAEGLVLSHCPKLAIQRLRSRDGVDFWLLGVAATADEAGQTIAEVFGSRHSSEIEGWTWFWAGRWLLISNHLCCQDASGSLAANYRWVDDSLWLSSSTALLGEHLPHAPRAPRIPWRIEHVKGMDWIPAPFTTREGVYKLLPQRTIDPVSGMQRPVRYHRINGEPGDTVASFATALQTVMANWARAGFTRRQISLTAGLDTRTVLAATCAARLDVRAYTNIYPFMNRCDRVLPPRLAALAGVSHVFPHLPAVSPRETADRRAVIAEHMDSAAAHPSFGHFADHDHSADSGPGSSSAHGTCFGLGRCFFWPIFARAGLSEVLPTADQLLEAFTRHSSWRPEPIGAWQDALQSWLETLSDPVPLAPDWRDRFHLDQRLGSWNANIQRAGDLVESTAFNPANCLRIFDLLLRPEPQKRAAGALQREAIRLMAPHLLQLPINPLPTSERVKRVAQRLIGPKIAGRLRPLKRLLKRSVPRQLWR